MLPNETEAEYEEAFTEWMKAKAPHISVTLMPAVDLRMRMFQYADARTEGRIKMSMLEQALKRPDRSSAWAAAIRAQDVPSAKAGQGTHQERQARPRGGAAPAPKYSAPQGSPSISRGSGGAVEPLVDQGSDQPASVSRPCCLAAAAARETLDTACQYPKCDGQPCLSLWGRSASKAIDDCCYEVDRLRDQHKRVSDQLFDDRGGSYVRILWELVQQLDRRVRDLEQRLQPTPALPSVLPTGVTMQHLASLLFPGAPAAMAAPMVQSGPLPPARSILPTEHLQSAPAIAVPLADPAPRARDPSRASASPRKTSDAGASE